MTHYVCSECGTESKNPGTCQKDFCQQQGLPLKPCSCEDGLHESVKNNWENKEADNPEQDTSATSITTLDLDSESKE